MIDKKSKLPFEEQSESEKIEQMKQDHKKMMLILKELSSHIEKHDKQIAAIEGATTKASKGSKTSNSSEIQSDEVLHGSVMEAMAQIETALHHHHHHHH